MIKKLVSYEDYNGEQQTEAFYFHISKSELLDNLALRVRLQAMTAAIGGAERELTDDEIQAMLDIIRDLIRLAYGQKSMDGKRFSKSDEIFQAFVESPAYDELLFGLFKDPDSAVAFMTGIIPKDLLEAVQKEDDIRPQLQDHLPKQEKGVAPEKTQSDVSFQGEVVDQQPTAEELEAVRQMRSGNNA